MAAAGHAAEAALEEIRLVAAGYSSLEIDLESGDYGLRGCATLDQEYQAELPVLLTGRKTLNMLKAAAAEANNRRRHKHDQ